MLNKILEDVQTKGMDIQEFKIDGRWHNFKWGEGEKKKGSYRAVETSHAIEFNFKNWKDPTLNYSITLSKHTLSEADLLEHQKRVEENLEADKRRKMIRWQAVKSEAEKIWHTLMPTSEHPYLTKKKIKEAYGSRVNQLGTLFIPARDADQNLWGFQMISPQGQKTNLKGARMKGCFHLLGEVKEGSSLYICEGFATAVTLHEATNEPCAIAFSSHFFLDAGASLKKKYPGVPLVFAGDSDEVGVKASRKAAKILKGNTLIPKFKSPHPDYNDWNDLKEIEGALTMEAQIYHHKESKEFPEAHFVLESLADLGVTCDINGFLFVEGHGKSLKQILSSIMVRSARLKEGVKRAFVEDFLSDWHPLEAERVKNEFIGQFFNPGKVDKNCELLRAFMRGFLKRDDDLSFKAILHFIWQVKRKMKGLPIAHHMMPIFCGGSGIGKSVAIQKLLAPLSTLVGTRSLDVFKDERVWSYFEKHYVVFFDEMAKSAKHAEMLKMVLTASHFDIEPKYDGLKKARQNATFIGATNYTLETIIPDETSNRRFFPIETHEETDRDVINGIDYLTLWQSIDETMDTPIESVLREIKSVQESYRNKSTVEMFLEEMEFKKTHQDTQLRVGILVQDLLKIYDEWRKEMRFDWGLNSRSLSAELKRLGVAKFESNSKTGHFLYSEKIASRHNVDSVFITTVAKPV